MNTLFYNSAQLNKNYKPIEVLNAVSYKVQYGVKTTTK
jgi:hypothetical protein